MAKSKVINEHNNLENEEFNFNIRRFVDNAPPPEPQDVHAHLQGGIPENEVKALNDYFNCYAGLESKLFEPLKPNYLKFSDSIAHKEDIKKLFDESSAIKNAFAQYNQAIGEWWQQQLPLLEQLPEQKTSVFDLYHTFSATLTEKLIALPILEEFKSRGSFAAYWNSITNDIKSVDASGWNAELIPDDEILQSQFPEVLKELKDNEARRDELQAKFDEVNEMEDDVWNEEDYEVWRSKELKEHKDSIKELKGERKEADKEYKLLLKRIKAGAVDSAQLKVESEKLRAEVERLDAQIEELESRIAKHSELEEELKMCKRKIKEIKDRKQALVDQARLLISPEEAKELIMQRWLRTLQQNVNDYLQAHQRQLLQAIENVWEKYTTTLQNILGDRQTQTELFDAYLLELGYE
ncbi:hypothetical protein [Phnomibacter ginsenosidimutans]|uniref:hypothetical protein n=1 Tax=Phnomibacter ginsenosidimutans TaxID=2676868 RepID=UPI0018D271C3|nr:hypothetical protein [Phnomibacter ginsenosidimutans]